MEILFEFLTLNLNLKTKIIKKTYFNLKYVFFVIFKNERSDFMSSHLGEDMKSLLSKTDGHNN